MVTTTAPQCFVVAYVIITVIVWAMITPYMAHRMCRQLPDDSLWELVVIPVVAVLGFIPALLWPIVIFYSMKK